MPICTRRVLGVELFFFAANRSSPRLFGQTHGRPEGGLYVETVLKTEAK